MTGSLAVCRQNFMATYRAGPYDSPHSAEISWPDALERIAPNLAPQGAGHRQAHSVARKKTKQRFVEGRGILVRRGMSGICDGDQLRAGNATMCGLRQHPEKRPRQFSPGDRHRHFELTQLLAGHARGRWCAEMRQVVRALSYIIDLDAWDRLSKLPGSPYAIVNQESCRLCDVAGFCRRDDRREALAFVAHHLLIVGIRQD